MNPEGYYAAKLSLREEMRQILERDSFDQEDVQEDIIHFLDCDEPQIAYTNLVAMFVNAGQPIVHELYKDIINLGESLDISNGVTWNEDETREWWSKLNELVT